MSSQTIPLFVCHANCARSVLAYYLYRHLSNGAPAESAGVSVGPEINDRVLRMLHHWGIDASSHRPRQLTRELCDQAGAIFIMSPTYLHRIGREHGMDLAVKSYLFADPFTPPLSFGNGEYRVRDPSWDSRPVKELVREWRWMRERVLQIRLAMLGDGHPLIPGRDYWHLVETVDPMGH
jgi:protein-tyrosine-phosphatase